MFLGCQVTISYAASTKRFIYFVSKNNSKQRRRTIINLEAESKIKYWNSHELQFEGAEVACIAMPYRASEGPPPEEHCQFFNFILFYFVLFTYLFIIIFLNFFYSFI